MKNKHLLITTVIVLAAGLTIYRSALMSVIYSVLNREGSSHGLFIPFLSAYFVWINWESLNKIEARYDYIGSPLLIIGLLFPVLTLGSYHIHFISFIIFFSGLIITCLGRKYFKEIAFPILFLITMTPLTGDVYQYVANITRHITFAGAIWIISLFDIPYYRDGWLIHLPNALLEVAIGCSGIRYFISYFVFGLAYAYLMKITVWGRLSVVLLTILISLLASILRLTAIFVMTYKISPYWSQPRPHVLISWAVFFTVLMLSIGLDQYFSKRKDIARLKEEKA
jgi:exosortase